MNILFVGVALFYFHAILFAADLPQDQQIVDDLIYKKLRKAYASGFKPLDSFTRACVVYDKRGKVGSVNIKANFIRNGFIEIKNYSACAEVKNYLWDGGIIFSYDNKKFSAQYNNIKYSLKSFGQINSYPQILRIRSPDNSALFALCDRGTR